MAENHARSRATDGDADRARRAEAILGEIPADDRDRLVPLIAGAPALLERLLGRRPHRACLWRWATRGTAGVTLATVLAGRTSYTSARMIAEYLVGAAHARRVRDAERRAGAVKPLTRASVKAPRDTDRARRTRDTLGRHGLAPEEAP